MSTFLLSYFLTFRHYLQPRWPEGERSLQGCCHQERQEGHDEVRSSLHAYISRHSPIPGGCLFVGGSLMILSLFSAEGIRLSRKFRIFAVVKL